MPFILSKDEYTTILHNLIKGELLVRKSSLSIKQVEDAIWQAHLNTEAMVQVEINQYNASTDFIHAAIDFIESKKRMQVSGFNRFEGDLRQKIGSEEQTSFNEIKRQEFLGLDQMKAPMVNELERILQDKFQMNFIELVSRRSDLFIKPGSNVTMTSEPQNLSYTVKSILLKHGIHRLQQERFNSQVSRILEEFGGSYAQRDAINKVSVVVNEILSNDAIDIHAKSEHVAIKLQSKEVQTELQNCSKPALLALCELLAWVLSFGSYVSMRSANIELSRTIQSSQDLYNELNKTISSTSKSAKTQSSRDKIVRPRKRDVIVGFAREAAEIASEGVELIDSYSKAREQGQSRINAFSHACKI